MCGRGRYIKRTGHGMGDDQGYPKELHDHPHPCEAAPSKSQIELPVRYDKRVWDAQRGNFWSGHKNVSIQL